MPCRSNRTTAVLTVLAALAAIVLVTPAAGAVSTTQDGPQGLLVERGTLPDVDDVTETTPAGSVVMARGRKTVRAGQDLKIGFVIHVKDGGPVTYGIEERIRGTWYPMISTTRTDPADGCAMGGPGWPVNAPIAGKVRVRGFSEQDGVRLVTPSYTVRVKPAKQ